MKCFLCVKPVKFTTDGVFKQLAWWIPYACGFIINYVNPETGECKSAETVLCETCFTWAIENETCAETLITTRIAIKFNEEL